MVTLYSLLLGLFVLGLLAWDYLAFRKHGGRYFMLELLALGVALPFVVVPSLSQSIASAAGVGRGVDVLIYPLLLWLVRDSFVARQKRWIDNQRLTELVRTLSIKEADPGSRK